GGTVSHGLLLLRKLSAESAGTRHRQREDSGGGARSIGSGHGERAGTSAGPSDTARRLSGESAGPDGVSGVPQRHRGLAYLGNPRRYAALCRTVVAARRL